MPERKSSAVALCEGWEGSRRVAKSHAHSNAVIPSRADGEEPHKVRKRFRPFMRSFATLRMARKFRDTTKRVPSRTPKNPVAFAVIFVILERPIISVIDKSAGLLTRSAVE